MNPYSLALVCLGLALLAQFVAAGLATFSACQRPYSRTYMIIAMGLCLMALKDSLTLELAMRTGLFDLRQAMLAAGVSFLLLIGVIGLRRHSPETLPPR